MKFRFMCLPLVVFLAISTIFFTADVSAAELVSEETETSSEPIQVAYDDYMIFKFNEAYLDSNSEWQYRERFIVVADTGIDSYTLEWFSNSSRSGYQLNIQSGWAYDLYYTLDDAVDALKNGGLTVRTTAERYRFDIGNNNVIIKPLYNSRDITIVQGENTTFFPQAPLTETAKAVMTVGGMKSTEVVTATLQGIKTILPYLLLFVIGCLAFWKAWTFLRRILQKA